MDPPRGDRRAGRRCGADRRRGATPQELAGGRRQQRRAGAGQHRLVAKDPPAGGRDEPGAIAGPTPYPTDERRPAIPRARAAGKAEATNRRPTTERRATDPKPRRKARTEERSKRAGTLRKTPHSGDGPRPIPIDMHVLRVLPRVRGRTRGTTSRIPVARKRPARVGIDRGPSRPTPPKPGSPRPHGDEPTGSTRGEAATMVSPHARG